MTSVDTFCIHDHINNGAPLIGLAGQRERIVGAMEQLPHKLDQRQLLVCLLGIFEIGSSPFSEKLPSSLFFKIKIKTVFSLKNRGKTLQPININNIQLQTANCHHDVKRYIFHFQCASKNRLMC